MFSELDFSPVVLAMRCFLFWKCFRQKMPVSVALLQSGLLSMFLCCHAVPGMTSENQVGMESFCQGAELRPFLLMHKTLKTSAKIRAGCLRSRGRLWGGK